MQFISFASPGEPLTLVGLSANEHWRTAEKIKVWMRCFLNAEHASSPSKFWTTPLLSEGRSCLGLRDSKEEKDFKSRCNAEGWRLLIVWGSVYEAHGSCLKISGHHLGI